MTHFWYVFAIAGFLWWSSAEAQDINITGDFRSCNSSDDGQRQEALVNLHERARAACNNPAQTSDVFFEEAAACRRYRRGQLAFASFVCLRPDAQAIKQAQVSASVPNTDCEEFVNEYGNHVEAYRHLSLKIRDEAMKQCSDSIPKIHPETVVYDCQSSILSGTALYSCIQ